MAEALFFLDVKPGVLAAILFIGLDIITLGILDVVLSRVVCLIYYCKINRGRPVSVRSADIPGLTNYLLGKFFSVTNLAALTAKLSLLAIVFVVNLRIDNADQFEKISKTRTAVFNFNPSDAAHDPKNVFTVRRRPESSKSCVIQDNDALTYYRLAFDLRDNVELTNDIGTPDVNQTGQYDIDDSTVICMSKDKVHEESVLVKVNGCTKRPSSGCLTVISKDVRKDARNIKIIWEKPWQKEDGEPTHNLTLYNPEQVKQLWKEYPNPQLTCLSTSVGIAAFGGVSRYRHCLMVSRSAKETLVERWILRPNKEEVADGDFTLEYPGVKFDGDIPIGRRAAVRYLETLFPFTTYRSLSAQLIANGAVFSGQEVKVDVKGKINVVTTIPKWTVFLVGAAVVVVLIGRIVTFFALRNDKRPKFNTIDGLSSIVREECVPTGRSYNAGDSAILGLRYTMDDLLHFGPLRSQHDGTRFEEDHDIS